MERISKFALTACLALLLAVPAGPAAAQDELEPVAVTFGWTPCPTRDELGRPLAPAVRYEVFLERSGEAEQLVASLQEETRYVLAAERGVVQRIRVVGYDEVGRPSPSSEWSDPIYFAPEQTRNSGELPPTRPALGPNYPNPFNPETRIVYGVPLDAPPQARMALEIYDLRGQRVRTLPVDTSPGWHEVTWNGLDDRGLIQSTGTYVTRFVIGDQVEVGKMTMVK
jgi:hypothetical protein